MTPRRLKLLVILAGALLGALTLVAWTQQWFELDLRTGEKLVVTGQVAAPALSALGLASLALVGALSIAGRGVRAVLGALQLIIGSLVVASALSAIADPVRASLATVTAAVGESGSAAASALVVATNVGVWPWLAFLFGTLSAAVGLVTILTLNRWPGPTRKYETAPAVDDSAVGQWDALSKGDDPT